MTRTYDIDHRTNEVTVLIGASIEELTRTGYNEGVINQLRKARELLQAVMADDADEEPVSEGR